MSNRRNNLFLKNSKTRFNSINFLLILTLLISFGLACSSENKNETTQIPKKFTIAEETIDKPRKLEGYEIRGVKFSYYLIPKNLNHDDLISTAQKIHEQEPDTQLILVDDDSQLADYIAYAKQISLGNSGGTMPKAWADRHIIGNVQKYLSGKWVLCEGNGYREIAELK
jgi:hypothetical protein